MRGPYPPGTAPEFRPLIEAVYDEFAAPTPRAIEGCPCCRDRKAPDALLAKPLRTLLGSDLRAYVGSVFLTIGSPRDYRYLLPRILELAVIAPGDMPNTEITLGTLARAGWRTWPVRERKAVEALIDHWVGAALDQDLYWLEEEGYAGTSSGDVICGAARAGLDIAPWLAHLARPEFEPLREGLVTLNQTFLRREKPPPFWEDVAEAWRALAVVLQA